MIVLPLPLISRAATGSDFIRKQPLNLESNQITNQEIPPKTLNDLREFTKLSEKSLNNTSNKEIGYVPDEILVKFKDNIFNLKQGNSTTGIENFAISKNLVTKENISSANITVLKTNGKESVEQKIAELKNDPRVEYAEPNYKRYLTDINTNDTNWGLLWGMSSGI